MDIIEKALIVDFNKTKTELEERINEINRLYDDNDDHHQFEPDSEYLCLGFTGMQDEIVLVSKHGRVFSLPFDEDFIHLD